MAITEKKYVDLTGLGTFRDSLKAKLAGNSASAWTVNYAINAANADIATKYKTETGSASIEKALASKVDNTTFTEKVNNLVPKTTTIAGVDLGDNISKGELLTALNVADGAQVNVIEGVSLDGVAQTIGDNKIVTLDLSNYAKVSDITAVLKFKGVESTLESLNTNHPASKDQVGHVWIVTEGAEYAEYVCVDTNGDTADGYKWEKLGVGVDLSGYYTKTQTDAAISTAVNTAKGEITNAYKEADTALKNELQGNINALYKVVADGKDTGVIAGRLDAVETKATSNASAIATLNGADTVKGSVAKSIKDAIEALDGTSSAGTANGGYILSVTQTNGKVAVKTASFSGDVASAGSNAVTGTAVSTYVTTQIGALDVTDIGEAGKFISAVGETDGKIHATPIAFATTVKATTTAEADKVAPTEHAVRTAIDNAYNAIGSVTEAEIQGLFA